MLVAELGLEPSPALKRLHGDILAHADSLQPAASSMPTAPVPRRRNLLVAVGVALAAAVGASAFVAFGRESSRHSELPQAQGGVLISLDAATGARKRQIAVGDTPTAVAVGEDAVWLVDANTRTVSRVDTHTGGIDTFGTGATPTDVAVGGGAVWLGQGARLRNSQFAGPVATSVARIDAGARTTRAELALPRSGGALSALVDNHLAVTRDAVWVVGPDFAVTRIDARSNGVTSTTRGLRASAVAAGKAGVWVLGVDGTLAELDSRTGKVLRRTRIPASSVTGLAVGDRAVWVTSSADGTLWRTAVGRQLTPGSLTVGSGAADVTAEGQQVWVANGLQGTVTEVAARTNSVVRTIEVGGAPRSVAARGGRSGWRSRTPTHLRRPLRRAGSLRSRSGLCTRCLRRQWPPRPPRGIGSAASGRDSGLRRTDGAGNSVLPPAPRFPCRALPSGVPVMRRLGGPNGSVRRGEVRGERAALREKRRRDRRHRPAQLPVCPCEPPHPESRTRRPSRDRLAAEFVPRAYPRCTWCASRGARWALSDRYAQLPARLPDGRRAGCCARRLCPFTRANACGTPRGRGSRATAVFSRARSSVQRVGWA